jgi:hypothetical protein
VETIANELEHAAAKPSGKFSTGPNNSENPVDLLLDMQIGHQAGRMRSPIGIAGGIEGHAPHDGAEKKGDNVDLDPHEPIATQHIGIYVAMLKYFAIIRHIVG